MLLAVQGCAWSVDSARRVARLANFTASTGVDVRKRPRNPLEQTMTTWSSWTGHGGLQPTDRTRMFLRQYALEDAYQRDPVAVLAELRSSCDRYPDLRRLQVLAELSYIEGDRKRIAEKEREAGQLLSMAVMASYQYLFDPRLDIDRNAYDPLFRQVCDTYNASLEGLLRIMKAQDALRPGGYFIATSIDDQPLRVAISMTGRWREHEFERFEFVTDYDIRGLKNIYQTWGLGVPLIGIRHKETEQESGQDKYYPEGLSVPLTAFVQVSMQPAASSPDGTSTCLIQLLDPLEQNEVRIGDRRAPLQSDITTPVAYFLGDPLLGTDVLATAALLDGNFAQQFRGIYMLEPFDPDKIPVLMVHGLWSSPTTWTPMFNDLRADKAIRHNYQFWFYMYPSGQPFWFSARQLREDLAALRQQFDPEHKSAMLDQMVLVGHSMGGLVSRLQTLESDDDFWRLVSDRPLDELQADPETRQSLRDTLYFEPNRSIARVITIGTPHRGSNFANSTTRWISNQFFRMPMVLKNQYKATVSENPQFFREGHLFEIVTSVDALSPRSPFFETMQRARRSDSVVYHNIVGVLESKSTWFGKAKPPSDGVVELESARSPDTASEISIPEEHSKLHSHPLAILEVRRILIEQLESLGLDSEIDTATETRHSQSDLLLIR